MRRIITIALSAIILFITGCAGNKAAGNSKASLFSESVAEVISNEPEWWTTPDEKEAMYMVKVQVLPEVKMDLE